MYGSLGTILQKRYPDTRKSPKKSNKLVPWLRKYPYEIRLQKLGILSLGQRRIRGDLIEDHERAQ